MPIQVLADDCGCLVEVAYSYLPITDDIIEAYALSGNPQNKRIYQAFDAAFRYILSQSAVQVYNDRFTITGTGTYDSNGDEIPVLTYSRPDLEDALEILSVGIEGQGIDESDPTRVDINTGTGTNNVVFGRATVGQKVQILYKKASS